MSSQSLPWFRMYTDFLNDHKMIGLSANAQRVAEVAHDQAERRRYCYPNWVDVANECGMQGQEFHEAFWELCEVGVISQGFPSVLTGLSDRWPVAPMFGPIKTGRPSAEVWMKLRQTIFARDDYTCQYCGARGVKLECDHIIPVAHGGGHTDDNLTTACFACNRSKGHKLLNEWRQHEAT